MRHFSKFFSGNHFPAAESQPNISQTTKEHLDKEIANISTFVRSGLVVLSIILLSSIAVAYSQKQLNSPEYASTTSAFISEKKLPIYCVDDQKKRVASKLNATRFFWSSTQ